MKKKAYFAAAAISLATAATPLSANLISTTGANNQDEGRLLWSLWSAFSWFWGGGTTGGNTNTGGDTGGNTGGDVVVDNGQNFSAVISQARSTFGTLNDKTIPLPSLDGIVKDKNAAIRLGKALFWDVAIGSDGQSCGSCHFQAGADPRLTNQFNPGFLDARDVDGNGEAGDQMFGGLVTSSIYSSPEHTRGLTASGAQAASNYTVTAQDFPLHKLANASDRNSEIRYTTNDVFSSQGTYDGQFVSVPTNDRKYRRPSTIEDDCGTPSADVFHVNGLPSRRVEPRNTPTTINSVFNFRNFWDGRANNVYNGVDVFGERDHVDPRARVLVRSRWGSPYLQKFAIENASLASQAMGPPLSTTEMSCEGRTFADIGRKVINLKPLATQWVSGEDSVLGNYASSYKGLKTSYQQMIRDAFADRYTSASAGWYDRYKRYLIDDNGNLVEDSNGYLMEELNFSLYWGIAIMMYESTLVSDDNSSKFGRLMAGNDDALSDAEKRGLDIFLNKGSCASCHNGPTLSDAALRSRNDLVERMDMADLDIRDYVREALYDGGFYNIGVTPTVQDLGIGGADPYGNPLSIARQFTTNTWVDPFRVNLDYRGLERVALDGSFKTPNLLNVALTAPYFHNGGAASLEQVVAFYNRGGNRRDIRNRSNNLIGDTTGTGLDGRSDGNGEVIDVDQPGSNLDPDVKSLGLSDGEQADLVAFLKTLTDERVQCDKAPFDRPELAVPMAQVAMADAKGRADTRFTTLPAVGRNGVSSDQCIPNTGNLFDLQLRLN